ncbi:MAG: hypothetical protein ACI9XK_000793 [Granulosicoccus sp.]|jgi:hypothetical protein
MKSFENLITAQTRAAITQNNHIKQLISQIVPASSAAHIEFCRIEGGRLRVTVDSAAWIAKLRFCERQMIQALRLEKLDVHTASWHVAPIENPKPRVTLRKPNELSSRSAAALTALANATTDNPYQSSIVKTTESGEKLRQELLKLAAKLRD